MDERRKSEEETDHWVTVAEKRKRLDERRRKKARFWNTLLISIVVLAVLYMAGPSVFQIALTGGPKFQIKILEFTTETGDYGMTVNMDIEIAYSGILARTLSEREMTSYINGINCGTIGFAESWELYRPSYSYTYSTTQFISDSKVQEITEADLDSFNVSLKFKAKSKTWIFSSFVEIECTSSWNQR